MFSDDRFRMITALPVPSVKVFHKTYYQEKSLRMGNSQPGSPLAESEAVLAMIDKEPPEYYFCGKVRTLSLCYFSLVVCEEMRTNWSYSRLIRCMSSSARCYWEQ